MIHAVFLWRRCGQWMDPAGALCPGALVRVGTFRSAQRGLASMFDHDVYICRLCGGRVTESPGGLFTADSRNRLECEGPPIRQHERPKLS